MHNLAKEQASERTIKNIDLSKEEVSQRIAKNIAELFNFNDDITILNLGVGIPTMVSNYINNENIYLHPVNISVAVMQRQGDA